MASPTCTTLDREHQPADRFRAGDELILRGSRFPPASFVLATFQQAPQASELGRFKTNDAGEFTSVPTIVRVPTDASTGLASIRISSGGGSATCELGLTAAPAAARPRAAKRSEPLPDEMNPWLFVWATLVALGAGFLTYLTYRRWQAERLERAMSRLEGTRSRRGREATPLPPAHDVDANAHDRVQSPPVLPTGWDAGREPTPLF